MEWQLTEEDFKKAEKNGICRETVKWRFYSRGWTVEQCITKETRKVKNIITADIAEKLIKNGIERSTYLARIYRGWPVEEACTRPLIPHNNKIYKPKADSLITKKEIEIARKNGICYSTVAARVYSLKWEVKDAITKPVKKQYRRKDI